AGSLAGVAEAPDQSLDDIAGFGTADCGWHDRAAQRVGHCAPKVEALDALRCPIGRNLVARHSPDFLRVRLEENREQPFAELIRYPFVEGFGVLVGERLFVEI